MRPMEFLRLSSKTISSKSEQKWVLNYISSIMVAVFNGVGWPAKKIKKLKLKKIGYQLGSKVGVWVIFESLSCSLLCYLNRRFLPLYMKSCCSRYCSFLFFFLKKKCEASPKNFGPNFYCSLLCSICYLLLWGHSVLCPINKLKSITIFWLCDYDKNLLMVSNLC